MVENSTLPSPSEAISYNQYQYIYIYIIYDIVWTIVISHVLDGLKETRVWMCVPQIFRYPTYVHFIVVISFFNVGNQCFIQGNTFPSITVNYNRGYRLQWNTMSYTVLDILRYDRRPYSYLVCCPRKNRYPSLPISRHLSPPRTIYAPFAPGSSTTRSIRLLVNGGHPIFYLEVSIRKFPSIDHLIFFPNLSPSLWVQQLLTKPVIDNLVYTIYCSPPLYLFHRRFPITSLNITL